MSLTETLLTMYNLNIIMKKQFITSLSLIALATSASAFTLDVTQLPSVFGTATISQNGHEFTVYGSSPSAAGRLGDSITIVHGESITIQYPAGVEYLFARQNSGSQNTAVPHQITFNGATRIKDIEFEAVPEPTSTALLGLGSLALVMRRRK